MKAFRLILIIGVIEILIGTSEIFFNLIALALSINKKSFNVLCFVLTAGVISTLIGFGILKFKRIAYQLLIYFSSVIILSKILLLTEIIHLNGAFESIVSESVRSFISIAYHGFVIYYLRRPDVRLVFHS